MPSPPLYANKQITGVSVLDFDNFSAVIVTAAVAKLMGFLIFAALRTLLERRTFHLPNARTSLISSCVRYASCRYCHINNLLKLYRIIFYSSRSLRNASSLGSGGALQLHFSSFRSAPHTGHKPLQFSEHRNLDGRER